MQGFADGHIAVIGHGRQKVKLSGSKQDSKEELREAASKANSLNSRRDAEEYPGSKRGCEGDLQEGEIPEKEVHGCLEVGIQQCEEDDAEIPHNAEDVREQEKEENTDLKLWGVCESQQNEFSQSLIFHHRLLCLVKLKKRETGDDGEQSLALQSEVSEFP